MAGVHHLLSFFGFAFSLEAAVPGRRRKVFLSEQLRKGKRTGPAGSETLQCSSIPLGYLQPLPGRTSLVWVKVHACSIPQLFGSCTQCLLLGSQDFSLNFGNILHCCEEFWVFLLPSGVGMAVSGEQRHSARNSAAFLSFGTWHVFWQSIVVIVSLLLCSLSRTHAVLIIKHV